jgi:hypothetical protein
MRNIIMSYFCATFAIMIKDKLQLSKTVKFMLSSSFVSIIISMCLLVNLFTPGFGTVLKSEKGSFPCEHHTCGCKTEPDCLNNCCCAKEKSTSEMKCLLEEDSNGLFSSFIQSLVCAGVPNQFTTIPYNVSLPEDSVSSPGLFMLYYMERLQTVFPTSIKMSPPYKPPRIT